MQVPGEQGALHHLDQLQGDVQGDGDELVDEDHEAQELHQDCAAPWGQVRKHPARRVSVAGAGKVVAWGGGGGRGGRGKGEGEWGGDGKKTGEVKGERRRGKGVGKGTGVGTGRGEGEEGSQLMPLVCSKEWQ